MDILGAHSEVKKRPPHLLASHILKVLSGIHSVTPGTFLSVLILSLVIIYCLKRPLDTELKYKLVLQTHNDNVPYRRNNCLLLFSSAH